MIGDRWGVTDAEIRRRYPCDDRVTAPAVQAWRGVTVQAPAERVWPWVRQIRVAPYSYDLLDNLGHRSPQALSALAEPVVGDPFTTAFGRAQGRVVAVVPGEHLTARIVGAYMSYVIVPEGERSRLLLKIVVADGLAARPLAPLITLGDLVMARRQLLNLARLAERSARAAPGTAP